MISIKKKMQMLLGVTLLSSTFYITSIYYQEVIEEFFKDMGPYQVKLFSNVNRMGIYQFSNNPVLYKKFLQRVKGSLHMSSSKNKKWIYLENIFKF